MTLDYSGKRAVLATKHGKEQIIAPIVRDAFGLEVFVPEAFDSDQFGTFTRERRRPADQLETARRKARAAMMQTGARIGIASEGSFGAHPTIPFAPHTVELVYFVDDERGFEAIGVYEGPKAHNQTAWVHSVAEVQDTATSWGFADHGIIVRLHPKLPFGIYKDLHSMDQLLRTVSRLLRLPLVRRVFLETDMRAHKNKTRRNAIAWATQDLVHALQSPCPSCAAPGFRKDVDLPGLPCATCHTPTGETHATRYHCMMCGYYEDRTRTDTELARASACVQCNP